MKILFLSIVVVISNITFCLAQKSPSASPTPVPATNVKAEPVQAERNINQPSSKLSRNLVEYRASNRLIDVYASVLHASQERSSKFQLKVVFRDRLWEDDGESLLASITGYIDGRQIVFADIGSASVFYEKEEILPKVIKTQNFAFDIPANELDYFIKAKDLSLTVKNVEIHLEPEKLLILSKFIKDER